MWLGPVKHYFQISVIYQVIKMASGRGWALIEERIKSVPQFIASYIVPLGARDYLQEWQEYPQVRIKQSELLEGIENLMFQGHRVVIVQKGSTFSVGPSQEHPHPFPRAHAGGCNPRWIFNVPQGWKCWVEGVSCRAPRGVSSHTGPWDVIPCAPQRGSSLPWGRCVTACPLFLPTVLSTLMPLCTTTSWRPLEAGAWRGGLLGHPCIRLHSHIPAR